MDKSFSKTLSPLPSADLSISSRAFRGAKQRVKEFSALLVKGLDAEIKMTTEEQTRLNLGHARKRLTDAVEQLIQSGEKIADRGDAARILDVGHHLMFACADAASRVERKSIPRTIEPVIKNKADKDHGRPGGDKSAKKRQEKAVKWHAAVENAATAILTANPNSPLTTVTKKVMSRCNGLPDYDGVYRYLLAWRKRTGQKLRS
jgi:hypothetical protein